MTHAVCLTGLRQVKCCNETRTDLFISAFIVWKQSFYYLHMSLQVAVRDMGFRPGFLSEEPPQPNQATHNMFVW